MTTPSVIVAKLLNDFTPKEPREAKVSEALRKLIDRQSFDASRNLSGPRVDISAIARHAGLSRNLVSHEGCELPGARDLILDALKLLSEYSLQVKCDYLIEEVKRLRARLDRYDSSHANRVVALHKGKAKVAPTPQKQYSPDEVRKSARIIPMGDL